MSVQKKKKKKEREKKVLSVKLGPSFLLSKTNSPISNEKQ